MSGNIVKQVYIDDTSPEIVYTGEWAKVPGVHGEWDRTIHETTQAGASATFRFKGVAVRALITIPSVPEGTVASVDVSIKFNNDVFGFQRQARTFPLHFQTVFEAKGLDDRVHSLTLTQRSNGGPSVLPLRFDVIQLDVDVPDFAASTSAAAPPSTTFALPSPTSLVSEGPSPSPSPQPQEPAPANPSLSIESPRSALSPTSSDAMDAISAGVLETSSPSSALASSSVDEAFSTSGNVVDHVHTNILPQDRIITSTDSTGGVITQTAAVASPGGDKTPILPIGAIVGLVIGIAFFLAMLGVGAFILLRRRRRNRSSERRDGKSVGEKDLEAEHPKDTASPVDDPHVIYPFVMPVSAANWGNPPPVGYQNKSHISVDSELSHSSSSEPLQTHRGWERDESSVPPPAYRHF